MVTAAEDAFLLEKDSKLFFNGTNALFQVIVQGNPRDWVYLF